MFEVSGSSLSGAKRLNDTSLRWIWLDWLQSFKEKPKTQDHFEKSHGRIEPLRVNRFGEAGENEINEGTDHAPGRRDNRRTWRRRSPWPRLAIGPPRKLADNWRYPKAGARPTC